MQKQNNQSDRKIKDIFKIFNRILCRDKKILSDFILSKNLIKGLSIIYIIILLLSIFNLLLISLLNAKKGSQEVVNFSIDFSKTSYFSRKTRTLKFLKKLHF